MNKYAFLISLLAASSLVCAPESRAGGLGEPKKAVEIQEHHEHHDNVTELFLGYAHSSHEDGFTIGLGYERRLNQILGIGVFGEYADGDFKEWIVGLPILLHPYKGLRLQAAPGIDFGREHRSKQFLFRLGVAYEFEFAERWAITPAFNVDFVDEEQVMVYGLSFSYAF